MLQDAAVERPFAVLRLQPLAFVDSNRDLGKCVVTAFLFSPIQSTTGLVHCPCPLRSQPTNLCSDVKSMQLRMCAHSDRELEEALWRPSHQPQVTLRTSLPTSPSTKTTAKRRLLGQVQFRLVQ